MYCCYKVAAYCRGGCPPHGVVSKQIMNKPMYPSYTILLSSVTYTSNIYSYMYKTITHVHTWSFEIFPQFLTVVRHVYTDILLTGS